MKPPKRRELETSFFFLLKSVQLSPLTSASISDCALPLLGERPEESRGRRGSRGEASAAWEGAD